MNVTPVSCPTCGRSTVILWANRSAAFCDKCLPVQQSILQGKKNEYPLLFSPQKLADGSWAPARDVEFRDLREYVDECLRPSKAKRFKGYLSSRPETISAVLELMVSKVVAATQNSLPTINNTEIGDGTTDWTQDHFDASAKRASERDAKGTPREHLLLNRRKLITAVCDDYRAHFSVLYGKTDRLPPDIFVKVENAVEKVLNGEQLFSMIAPKLRLLQDRLDLLHEEDAMVQAQIRRLAYDFSRVPGRNEVETLRKQQSAIQKQLNSIKPQLEREQQRFEAFLRRANNSGKTVADSGESLWNASKERQRIVTRLYREFRAWQRGTLAVDFNVPVHRVHWEILKPSGDSWQELVRYYERLSRANNKSYDLDRLRKVHDLGPDEIFVGQASFDGYVVFIFRSRNLAVLDCPEVGNALYLMDSKRWKFLSQMSKTELLRYHRGEVRRIVHVSWWLSDLEYVLAHPDQK